MRRMGCFGMLVLILLAVVAYDQWKIEQLRGEVAAIATKVHATKGSSAASQKSDLMTTLAEAEKYTRQAKEAMSNKKVGEAQAKLDKALHKLNSANGVSKDIIGDAAQYLGKAKDKAVEVFQKAWKDISEEPKQTKAKPEKSK
jgi:flagellin-specific chaperone FliS